MAPQKFIGGAERARRMAQSRGWEPPSQKKRRLEKEAEQKRKQKYRNKHHSHVVPLSTKKLRSSERFFAALLEASNFPTWKSSVVPHDNNTHHPPSTVLETICTKLGLGPPPPQSNQNYGHSSNKNTSFLPHTDNPRTFFSSRAILVMEEARYELEEALHKNLKRDKGNHSRKSSGSWTEMMFNSLDLDEKRTGFLFLGLSKAKGRFSPEELFQQKAGSCFELQVTLEGRNQTSTVSMLCSVAPGKPGSASTKLMLVVYERHAIDRLLSLWQDTSDETAGTATVRWKLRFCVTLLNHCRQFEACDFASVHHRKARSTLLKEIMGQKKATHIRFGDSDDEEGGETNDTIEEGEEEIVGYITQENDGDFADGENDNHGDGQSNGPQHSKLHLTMPCFTGLKSLNPTQKMAAEKFCSSDEIKATLELIQGPPGTGKTTFVVSVLARLLCQAQEKGIRKRPRRILVTAPTNKAAGVIAKRFMKSCPGLLDQHGIPIAMIGVQDKLLEPDEDGKVDEGLKRIFCYTWLDTLAEEYEVLLRELSVQRNNENHDSPSNSPENRGLSQWLSKTIPSTKNDTFMVGDDSDSDTEDENEDPRAPQADTPNIKPLSAIEIAKGLHLRLVRNLPWWSEASGASNLSRKLVAFLKDGDLAAACAYIEMLVKILKDENDNDDESDDDDYEEGVRAADAVPELLSTARIIFCTLSTAGTSLMKKTRRIDDWIVDEAAAATEPELLIPLHLDPNRLLLVGDSRQLPASVSSPIAEQWGLGRSLHERLTDDLGLPQTMLDVQYRMKPEISKFPSQQFYGGKLLNGDNVQEATYGSFFSSDGGKIQSWDLLQTTPPYSFLQIDGKEEQSHTGSYYNRAEASALVILLKAVRASFHLQQGNKTNPLWCSHDKIRVITFYSAQVAILRQVLRKEGLHGVLVATVDSSQGCEADMVILSFVRSTRAGFLRDDRRMNVGLTRARHKLICLGNFTKSVWALGGSDNTKSSSTLANLLCDANTRGCVSHALDDDEKEHS